MNNDQCVEVRDSNNIVGKGLFALKCFDVGQVVFVLNGLVLTEPTRESIHIGNGIHIVDSFGSYINHSFNPTTIISDHNIVAIKKICIDDEITFNYNESEINMANPFYVDGVHVSGKNEH